MHISHTIHPSRLAFNQLDQAFQRLFGRVLENNVTVPAAVFASAEVYEDEAHYHVLFDLPGIRKEEIAVQVSEGVLSISVSPGKTSESTQTESSLRREVVLPDDARDGEITAKLENGVLYLSLAKPARPSVKTVTIN